MSEDKRTQGEVTQHDQIVPKIVDAEEVKSEVAPKAPRPFLFVDPWDPNDDDDVGARKVRRHAAKASAGKRAATMAEKIKTQRAERLRHERQQRAARHQIETSARDSHQLVVRWSSTSAQSPSSSNIDQDRMDPFDAWEVNIRDNSFLRMLYNHTVFELVFLVDLRLPMISDRTSGKRFAGKKELPQLMLKSEPLFWAAMLGAASVFVNRTGSHAKDNPICVQYRYMALRGINQSIARSNEASSSDCGLVSAIATLGLWERQWGSKEIWQAHCKGLQMLQLKQSRNEEQEVLTQMAKACHIPDPVPATNRFSSRLRRIQQDMVLDQNLMSAVFHCRAIEYMSDRQDQLEALKTTAAQILTYSPMNAVSDTIFGSHYRSKDPEGERRNLEMHVLIQGAGIAMTNFMARDAAYVGSQEVDFLAMGLEAVELAGKVFQDSAYDEMLLWATFTMYSLTDFQDRNGLAIIRRVLGRLGIARWVDLERLLRDIAYLDFSTAPYSRLWARTNPSWGSSPANEAALSALSTTEDG